jgi:hypothetical protein
MFALQNAAFRGLLDRRASAAEILATSAEIEERMVKADRARGVQA